jgi:hypothetical protein
VAYLLSLKAYASPEAHGEEDDTLFRHVSYQNIGHQHSLSWLPPAAGMHYILHAGLFICTDEH